MLFLTRILIPSLIIMTLAACGSSQHDPNNLQAKLTGLEEPLAAQNLERGERVERIDDMENTDWRFLSEWSLIVTNADSQEYLVMLRQKCYGVGLPTTTLRGLPTKANQATEWDRVQVNNKGRTLDYCIVGSIYELDQIK
jgi:hypothetical protein